MPDRRIQIALAVVVAVALLGSSVGIYAAHRPAPPPIIISPSPAAGAPAPAPNDAPPDPVPAPAVAAPAKPVPPPEYFVHVAGAVKNPALYTLPVGSRVMNAIKAAGGPRADADLDAVNLAEKVSDGEKVYIPTKSAAPETTVMLAPPGNFIGHSSVDPSAAASSSASSTPSKGAKSAKAAKGGAAKADKLTSPSQGQVNINTASADELERLPGIGPAMAARILAYRQEAGGFQKIDELQEISGIGPKKYAKIAPLVKLH